MSTYNLFFFRGTTFYVNRTLLFSKDQLFSENHFYSGTDKTFAVTCFLHFQFTHTAMLLLLQEFCYSLISTFISLFVVIISY